MTLLLCKKLWNDDLSAQIKKKTPTYLPKVLRQGWFRWNRHIFNYGPSEWYMNKQTGALYTSEWQWCRTKQNLKKLLDIINRKVYLHLYLGNVFYPFLVQAVKIKYFQLKERKKTFIEPLSQISSPFTRTNHLTLNMWWMLTSNIIQKTWDGSLHSSR